eukprot:14474336-Alexandrium_andersonii.AAC.1
MPFSSSHASGSPNLFVSTPTSGNISKSPLVFPSKIAGARPTTASSEITAPQRGACISLGQLNCSPARRHWRPAPLDHPSY